MQLLPADESLIAFYFRAESLFARSTFGAQLERARAMHAAPPPSWAWRPPPSWHAAQPAPTLHVSSAHSSEPGYEVEHEDLVRYSQASKRVTAVGRSDTRLAAALAAYYGDRGARWAARSADRQDLAAEGGGRCIAGMGPGSIASLYPLTEAGRVMLQRERVISEGLRGGAGAPSKVERRLAARAVKEAAERRAELQEASAAALAAIAPLVATRQAAEWGLAEALRVAEEARVDGAVPAPHRRALMAARSAVRRAEDELDGARHRLTVLQRAFLRPAAPRNPLPDALRPPGAEGPLLPCGAFYTGDVGLPPQPARLLAASSASPPLHLTDDEQLEVVFLLHAAAGGKDSNRARVLRTIRDEAEALLVQAWGAWLRTDPRGPGARRGGPRRPRPHIARGFTRVEAAASW